MDGGEHALLVEGGRIGGYLVIESGVPKAE